jgi:septal ring factor EnvC (AmiA/AmiB activator)
MMLLALPSAGRSQDEEEVQVKERELEEVRERISELKETMDERAADRDRIAAELQSAEALIAEKRTHLEELERQRSVSEKKLQELDTEIAVREAELDEESGQLAAQVRAAYVGGRQERVRLLLNQRDPATLGRLLVYYRYLSDYRGRNIEAVTSHLEELAGLHEATEAEQDRLTELAGARYRELTDLGEAQEERQEILAALQSKMAEEGAELERLAAQEEDLSRLIAELTSLLSDYPVTSEEPFRDLKGRLTWPLAGQPVHRFGEPRAGGAIQWNGVVLAAPRGREVRAVYHGRVVFADWLDGLGLLVIVDHGEGYLTLYGYNETTLKSAGDWVAPGDVIATVGDSGGQPRTSLYFEIREGTKPVDPRSWFTREPTDGRDAS